MSVRIPPQQSRIVYYEVKAETLPAWFVIYCQFTGLPSRHGLNVQLELPHTVYLPQKQQLKSSDLSVRLLSFDPQEKRGIAEIYNHSQKLGRVESAQAIGSDTKLAMGGFPIFPDGRRQVEFTWSKLPPQKLVIRGKRYRGGRRTPC